MRYYAFEGGVSTAEQDNSIEITESGYKTALERMGKGEVVRVKDGKISYYKPVRKEFILDGERHETMFELPQDAETYIAEDWYTDGNGKYHKKDDEYKEKEAKKQELAELESYLASTDYIAVKLAEAIQEADKLTLRDKYAAELKKRQRTREKISELRTKL